MISRREHRLENTVQISIVILIGGMAGAASFTHVHDWTMHNVPPGTSGWFGWANAIISELTPTAAGLEIRRRKRQHQPISYPMTVLIAAAGLSLTAQVSQATATATGWIVAAVPALAFLALTKLVLSSGTPNNAPASTTDAADITEPSDIGDPGRPAHPALTAPLPDQLLSGARMAAFSHRQATGTDITADSLAEHLVIPRDLADQVLHAIDGTGHHTATMPPVTHLNGSVRNGSRP